jgi:hypothetical protein
MTAGIAAGTQSAHTRATLLRFLLVVFLVMKVAAVGSAWSQRSMLVEVRDGVQLTPERASANDDRERLIARVSLALFIGTAICWLFWQHRSYSNLLLVGNRATDLTPGESVGYWFIPFINLYQGYRITAELYRRSEIKNFRNPIDSGAPLVGAWWLLYLVWGGTGRFESMSFKSASTVDSLISVTNIELVNEIAAIVVTILALQVIRTIDRFQQEFPVTDQVPAQ